jgi:hypothetical protein
MTNCTVQTRRACDPSAACPAIVPVCSQRTNRYWGRVVNGIRCQQVNQAPCRAGRRYRKGSSDSGGFLPRRFCSASAAASNRSKAARRTSQTRWHGMALPSHGRGHRFNPCRAHHRHHSELISLLLIRRRGRDFSRPRYRPRNALAGRIEPNGRDTRLTKWAGGSSAPASWTIQSGATKRRHAGLFLS